MQARSSIVTFWSRTWWFALLLFSGGCLNLGFAFAQSTPPAKKVLTPDQVAYQQASARWLAMYNALRLQAQSAYKVEMAREKVGDCPNADNTRAQEECFSREIATTQANYGEVMTALRASLALEHPKMPGEQPYSGPTGTPLTASQRVAELDQLEAASAAYRKLAATAAYDEYKGGSLAPVFAAEAEQKLIRLHLKELAFLYETEFSNR